MHLVTDYVHSYKSGMGLASQCRVRVYLPDEVEDALVVLCSELATNLGPSVTEAAKWIAGELGQVRGPYASRRRRPNLKGVMVYAFGGPAAPTLGLRPFRYC